MNCFGFRFSNGSFEVITAVLLLIFSPIIGAQPAFIAAALLLVVFGLNEFLKKQIR
jgi:hypothetical protein